MFHNYFFLKKLAASLDRRITGLQVLECFSQNKNELVLGFGDATDQFYLRANLEPDISLLDFSDEYKRARKNSVDLFEEIIDQKVASVAIFPYERSFRIDFHGPFSLIFKMHASRSNILLAKSDRIIRIFRTSLEQDMHIDLLHLAKNPDLSEHQFRLMNGEVGAWLPPAGKEVKRYLVTLNYEQMDLDQKWNLVTTLLSKLENDSIYLYHTSDGPRLSLFPWATGDLVKETEDPLEVTSTYYSLYTRSYYLRKEKKNLLRTIENQIKKTQNYLENTSQKLDEVRNQRSHEEIANLIMANLHQIPPNQEKVELFDFYSNTNLTIKLNPYLTPQKNAGNYYRKAKNQKTEIERLEDNIQNRQKQLLSLQEQIEEITTTENIRDLRNLTTGNARGKEKAASAVPYHSYEFEGYTILIGKNAKSNDLLTLKVANKNDLWLHAKDVSGSHVVIRHQAGKTIPRDVLERAAEIAAWSSKRKTDSLCPVIYTPKKFVRKRKGDPSGLVVVDREDIIMVEPRGI